MGKKDITEKKILDFNDVFADIINTIIYDGKQHVQAGHLQAALPRSIYKVDGKISEQERDTAKYWRDDKRCFALIGIENQTKEVRQTLPLRIISYDGAGYRAQIRKRDDIVRENARLKDRTKKIPLPDLYPVITIVLYFGLKPWKEPLNLKSCFNIPDGFGEYVNDYNVNLVQVAFLDDETVGKFQNDFRIVAEYFVQSRKLKEGLIENYTISQKDMLHAAEILELMSVLTGDKSFEDAYNRTLKGGKDTVKTLINYIQEKADSEKKRADTEKKRADTEKLRADKAEARIKTLEDRLKLHGLSSLQD